MEQSMMIAGHFNEPDTYSIRRPNGMRDWLLFLTLDGEGYIRTPGGEKTAAPGEVALLRSGVPHQYGTRPGQVWNFMWIHIPEQHNITYLPMEEVSIYRMDSEPMSRRMQQAFQNVLHDSRERHGLWQELCENSVREILLLMSNRHRSRLDSRIETVLHILSDRMSEPIRIEELAASVRLSASRLSHLYKEGLGESILTTLNRMRIRQAALLIRQANRTATQAALDVGFQNYNHFAALFRKYMGVSPRVYGSNNKL
jgi:AraC family transcriptional regulator, arabinose operon regulatory protein